MSAHHLSAGVILFSLLGFHVPASGQLTKIHQARVGNLIGGYHNIRFFGADTGIAFATLRSPVRDVKLTTYDRGLTWTEHEFPSPPGAEVTSILSPSYYLWSDGYRTRDGGETIELDSAFVQPYKPFYFVDTLVGFYGRDKMEMFRTSDGGHSWVQVNKSDSIVGGGYDMQKYAFLSPAMGLAIPYEPVTNVLLTLDTGKTWTWHEKRWLGGGSATEIDWSTPSRALVFQRGVVNTSTDSGKSWSSLNCPGMVGYGGAFFDFSHAVIAGTPDPGEEHSRLIVAYTSDAGNSWRRLAVDSEGHSSSKVFFPSPEVAYIIGSHSLFRLDIGLLSADPTPSLHSSDPTLHKRGNHIEIRFPQVVSAELKLCDLLGRELQTQAMHHEQESSVQLPDYAGTYFLRVQWEGRTKVYKLIR